MFVYEKKLQYPVRIKNPNPKLASVIISQYGGAYPNRLQHFSRRVSPAADFYSSFFFSRSFSSFSICSLVFPSVSPFASA